MDPLVFAIPAALIALLLLGLVGRAIFDNPRGDFESGVAMLFGRWYARIVHAVRIRGSERIPKNSTPGPLIVVCNHTAGVDPVLVQSACPFHIRWVMAQDMRDPRLEWFWSWWEIIFVDRERHEGMGIRTALRHLKNGGVIGIFPEGNLERPRRQLLPFHSGVGVLIRRTGATVLPVVIDGTPQIDPAWASLWHASTAVVHIHEPIEYALTDLTPEEIAQDLRQRFLTWTGWPANELPPEKRELAGVGYRGVPASPA